MNLLASHRTISKAIRNLGLRKVSTKYCQIVEPRNRVKRLVFCSFSKHYGEKYEETIDADETTVELRYCASTNYKKDGVQLLRPSGGKLGKPKHNYKVHLFGGISRHCLTPLVIFTGTMYSKDYQNFLSASILPFIRKKLPCYHRFFMGNDTKQTSNSTKRFMMMNDINHFETPPQSPNLMPIEMVYFNI